MLQISYPSSRLLFSFRMFYGVIFTEECLKSGNAVNITCKTSIYNVYEEITNNNGLEHGIKISVGCRNFCTHFGPFIILTP